MKKLYPFLFFTFISSLSLSQSLTFTSKGIGGGGALFAPSINPTNENEFYVGDDMGELLHSTDSGNNTSAELMIVPNPVIEKFKVQGSTFKVEKIQLFNLIGEKQAEKSFVNKNSIEMDVRDLKRGVYLVKLFSGDKVVTKKIILK